ncbi:MAG: hypothetical protein V8Q32_05195 [Anaerotignum faecicola]
MKKERRFFVTLFLRKAAPAAALQAQASRRLAALFFPPREEKWVLLRFPFGKKLWWLPSFFGCFLRFAEGRRDFFSRIHDSLRGFSFLYSVCLKKFFMFFL